jgi:hypothetical protein
VRYRLEGRRSWALGREQNDTLMKRFSAFIVGHELGSGFAFALFARRPRTRGSKPLQCQKKVNVEILDIRMLVRRL